jgi:hypothetical protein
MTSHYALLQLFWLLLLAPNRAKVSADLAEQQSTTGAEQPERDRGPQTHRTQTA